MSKELTHATHAGALAMATRPDDLMAQIMRAGENGTPVASLEKLMDLYERVERRFAEKQFYSDLADFQAECPSIVKERTTKKVGQEGGKFDFTFSNLDDVATHVRPYLTPRGFSFTFDSSFDPAHAGKFMDVFCILRHRDGHSISIKCAMPIDSALSVGSQQKIGAALSYGKRYALIAALGLTLSDEEPQSARPSPNITDEQAATLQALIEEVKPNLPKLKKHFNVESLSELRLNQYAEASRILEALRKGAAK